MHRFGLSGDVPALSVQLLFPDLGMRLSRHYVIGGLRRPDVYSSSLCAWGVFSLPFFVVIESIPWAFRICKRTVFRYHSSIQVPLCVILFPWIEFQHSLSAAALLGKKCHLNAVVGSFWRLYNVERLHFNSFNILRNFQGMPTSQKPFSSFFFPDSIIDVLQTQK